MRCAVPCLASRPLFRSSSGTGFSFCIGSARSRATSGNRNIRQKPTKGGDQATETNGNLWWSAIYVAANHEIFETRLTCLLLCYDSAILRCSRAGACIWDRDRGCKVDIGRVCSTTGTSSFRSANCGNKLMADACNHISHVWAVGLLSQSTLVTDMHSSKLLLSTQRINVTLVDGELISVLLPTIVGGAVEK